MTLYKYKYMIVVAILSAIASVIVATVKREPPPYRPLPARQAIKIARVYDKTSLMIPYADRNGGWFITIDHPRFKYIHVYHDCHIQYIPYGVKINAP